jgi:TatD DNase family protein
VIDTHSHLNFPDLAGDVDGVLDRAAAAGVSRILVPGTDVETSTSAVELAVRPGVYAGVGIHPEEAGKKSPAEFRGQIKALLPDERIVAVGEVGLDYFRVEGDLATVKVAQQKLFSEMIGLAREFELPLIIHTRDAFDDALAMLKEGAPGHRIVIHCFTGSLEEAEAWIGLGCFISFTGILTYPKNQELRETAAALPLDRIMIETDAPYLAPQKFRGNVCEPAYVAEVARCLAEVRGVALEEIDAMTTHTAEEFFNLSSETIAK